MEIINNKKGVFFTFIAVFLVIFIVIAVSTRNPNRYREKSYAISTRIRTMNNFVDDFENDMQREMFIGGYRSLLSLQKYIRIKKGFIQDLDSIFSEIFENGTANGTEINIMKQEGHGADITSWLSRINEESEKLNIEVNLYPRNIDLEMNSFYTVKIIFDATINISDKKDLAVWAYNKTFRTIINVTGFEDPLYTVHSDDKVSNLIFPTTFSDFVDDSTNDTTNLKTHLNNSYYITSTDAPSFLMRFTGNLSNSSMGIESMVYLDDFQKQGLSVKNKTLIDYLYFNNITTTDYCNVENMQDWFRIDQNHAGVYEIDILEKDSC
ncbi:hypothetical protein GF327_02255 [Candidatus Woesearchaeota archaeon]|nr:hypothetical protein [Candidatus Woesearchaeota archaeon]